MHRYLQEALAEIDAVAGPLDSGTLMRPAGGRWSIAEILEHLTLAFTLTVRALEKALASGELRVRRPTLKQRVGRVLVLDFGRFPRAEAPPMTRPTGSIPPEQSVQASRDALRSLDETLDRVARRFGEHVPVANHPFFAAMTVAQWRKLHWRHTRHHMRQVRTRVARHHAAAR